MKFRKFRMKFRNEISLLKSMINNFISNHTETDNQTPQTLRIIIIIIIIFWQNKSFF